MLRYNDGTFYNEKPLSDLIWPSHDRPEEGSSVEISQNMGRGVDRNQRRSGHNKLVFLFYVAAKPKTKVRTWDGGLKTKCPRNVFGSINVYKGMDETRSGGEFLVCASKTR